MDLRLPPRVHFLYLRYTQCYRYSNRSRIELRSVTPSVVSIVIQIRFEPLPYCFASSSIGSSGANSNV